MRSSKKQIDTLFTMSKERGLSPMWTHYYRTNKKGERILAATTCVLLDKDCNPVSRGISVVSKRDNGEKAYGRCLSIKRAYSAAMTDKVPVFDEEPDQFISTKGIEGFDVFLSSKALTCKTDDNELTDLEVDRIEKKRGKLLKSA